MKFPGRNKNTPPAADRYDAHAHMLPDVLSVLQLCRKVADVLVLSCVLIRGSTPSSSSSSSFVRQLSYFQAGRCQPDPGVLVQVGQAPLSIRWPVHYAVVHDVLHRLVGFF